MLGERSGKVTNTRKGSSRRSVCPLFAYNEGVVMVEPVAASFSATVTMGAPSMSI